VTEFNPAPEEEAWLDVFEHREQRMITEAAFVLTALAVPHQVTRHLEQPENSPGLLGQLNLGQGTPGPWRLSVPVSSAKFAGNQLETYWSENANLSKRPPESPAIDSGVMSALPTASGGAPLQHLPCTQTLATSQATHCSACYLAVCSHAKWARV